MIRLALGLVAVLSLIGCGGEPYPTPTSDAVVLPPCDPALVGGNLKCTASPLNDQPSALVECSTYAYAPDGSHVGITPVSGCTLEFTARPGVNYTAECVAVCP